MREALRNPCEQVTPRTQCSRLIVAFVLLLHLVYSYRLVRPPSLGVDRIGMLLLAQQPSRVKPFRCYVSGGFASMISRVAICEAIRLVMGGGLRAIACLSDTLVEEMPLASLQLSATIT